MGHLHLKTKNTNDILKVEISLVKIWKYVIEISEETTEVEKSWLVIIFISGPSHCCTARQVVNYRNTTFLDFIAQYLPLKKHTKLKRSFKWLLGILDNRYWTLFLCKPDPMPNFFTFTLIFQLQFSVVTQQVWWEQPTTTENLRRYTLYNL